VGITLAILYRLSDLLDRSMHMPPSLNPDLGLSETSPVLLEPPLSGSDAPPSEPFVDTPIELTEDDFKKFNQDLNDLLLSRIKIGRNGRYKINLRKHEDLIRLIKEDLLELAADPEVLAISNGTQRTIKTSTGLYAGDKRKKLSPNTIECFRRFVANPHEFLNTYYPDFFSLDSTGDIDKLLDLRDRNVLFVDFRELAKEKYLGNVGQIFTFTPVIKGTSHLDDYDFTVAVNEIITRLLPGGGHIDDGVLESYTWDYRIDQLRQIQEHLGPEYRFWLTGDSKKPCSFIIQRGMPDPDNKDQYIFSETELATIIPLGHFMKPLSYFERTWPDAAYMNQITGILKEKFVNHLKKEIGETTIKENAVLTWKNAGFEPIYKKVKEAFGEFKRETPWRGARKRIKRGKKRLEPFWAFFTEKYGDIDRLIQLSLEKYYKTEEEEVA